MLMPVEYPMADHRVVGGTYFGGYVLDERSAESHIHYLESSTDRECRESGRCCQPRELDFELVSVEIDSVHLVARTPPVTRWVHVATATQNEPVEAAQKRCDVLGRHWCKKHRHTACAQYRVGIRALN